MIDITNLEGGDTLRIYHESLKQFQFDVRDVSVENIGIGTVVAVGLSVGCELYSFTDVLESEDSGTLEHVDSGESFEVDIRDVELVTDE